MPSLPTLSDRTKGVLAATAGGASLALSVPPWGWWPLAFVGVALWDRALAGRPARSRFGRSFLFGLAWLYPAMLWMFDLTAPGYVAAGAFYAAYFGIAAALSRPRRPARLVLPGAIALAEAARWSWPFGGVPLANLALSQVDTPLVLSARLGGSPSSWSPVVGAGARPSRGSGTGARPCGVAVLVVLVTGAPALPRATVAADIDVALVQGGGAQRTRASSDQRRWCSTAISRHRRRSSRRRPGDLARERGQPRAASSTGRAFELADLARRLETPLLAGGLPRLSDSATQLPVHLSTPMATGTTATTRSASCRSASSCPFVA